MNHDWTVFQNGCAALRIPVSDRQIGQLAGFCDCLLARNKQMNLTAITKPEEVQVLHFLDSLAPVAFCEEMQQTALRLIDVGTGAGFPGMVLKILFPAWEVTLLDALQKRTDFLRDVAGLLSLSGITIIHGRAEEVARDFSHREQYDIACARAVSPLRILSEYLLPFVRTGGMALAYKTPDDGAELEGARDALRVLGGGDPQVTDYDLPGTDIGRRLIRTEKTGATPEKYPRRAGIPEKRPL